MFFKLCYDVLCVSDTGGLLSFATQWWRPSCPGPPTVHHTSGPAPTGVIDKMCGEGLDDHTGWPNSQWKDQPGEAVGSADRTPPEGHGYEQFNGHHRASGGLRTGNHPIAVLVRQSLCRTVLGRMFCVITG